MSTIQIAATLLALSRYNDKKIAAVEWFYNGRDEQWMNGLTGLTLQTIPIEIDFEKMGGQIEEKFFGCIVDDEIKIREDYNDTFFDIIDTEEKAYWLGFMYADGNVPIKISSCEVSLQILDVDHLIKFKSDLHARNKINYDFKIERCRFHFGNKHLKQALIKQGCVPQKSLILTFPSNPPDIKNLPFLEKSTALTSECPP